MHRILLALAISCMFLISCEQGLIYSDFQPISQGSWDKDDIKVFNFSEMDSMSSFQMFINVRNDNSFPYSNLFLITELEYPNGETFIDTLEYEMALPNGQWLGKGYGSIKENKLWYKENIVFPVNGVYTLRIGHAMRKNGSVNGIIELPGITDIGVEIEKLN
ncbi:MAG: gliding motility lipoprotein GldH [Eudoraea sp.]|nr:gliding motility lipoprotein GldH [Eudoraea sp.]